MARARDASVRFLAAIAALLALAAIAFASGCGDDDDESAESADNAVELSGRIDQVATKFSGYGFVTRLDGVESSELTEAGGSEITEKDARVTFKFDAGLESRAVVGNSFSIATEGTISFYLDDEPGADFEDPDSFASGDEVATGTLRATDVVTVYAPDSGIATATGAMELEDGGTFELGNTETSIGESGDEFRLELVGRGARTDALIPESNFDFAGQLLQVD